MAITVNFQGSLADNTGRNYATISETGTLSSILEYLKEKYPALNTLSFVVSINGIITHGEKEIGEEDKLVLIPPAPGG